MSDPEVEVHQGGGPPAVPEGVPIRVQVAFVVMSTLRSPPVVMSGATPMEAEVKAINAACQVLTLYLLGENDYRDNEGRGRIVRPQHPGGPGPTPAGVPS